MATLLDFVNKNELNALKNDFEFRCKNFRDKYMPLVQESIKEQIGKCNLKEMWLEPHWVFNYGFLSSDIKILDPDYPENAFIAVKNFAKECIAGLGGIFVDIRLDVQQDEKIILEIMIENPIK